MRFRYFPCQLQTYMTHRECKLLILSQRSSPDPHRVQDFHGKYNTEKWTSKLIMKYPLQISGAPPPLGNLEPTIRQNLAPF